MKYYNMNNWYKTSAQQYRQPDLIFLTQKAINELNEIREKDRLVYNQMITKIRGWPQVEFDKIAKSDNQLMSIKIRTNSGPRVVVNFCPEIIDNKSKGVLYVRRAFKNHKLYDAWLRTLDAYHDQCLHNPDSKIPKLRNDLKSGSDLDSYHPVIEEMPPIDVDKEETVKKCIDISLLLLAHNLYDDDIYKNIYYNVDWHDLPELDQMLDRIYGQNIHEMRKNINNQNLNKELKDKNNIIMKKFKDDVSRVFDNPNPDKE